MVPFRLTQNMIDGFGVSGHEGVFRRCCEITLEVRGIGAALVLSHQLYECRCVSVCQAVRQRSPEPCTWSAVIHSWCLQPGPLLCQPESDSHSCIVTI